jgi:hypothetical protein
LLGAPKQHVALLAGRQAARAFASGFGECRQPLLERLGLFPAIAFSGHCTFTKRFGWKEIGPGGRSGASAQVSVPVGAAQPGNVGSFGRNRRFRHFNKLTVHDFAGAKHRDRAADAHHFARRRNFDCAAKRR